MGHYIVSEHPHCCSNFNLPHTQHVQALQVDEVQYSQAKVRSVWVPFRSRVRSFHCLFKYKNHRVQLHSKETSLCLENKSLEKDKFAFVSQKGTNRKKP